MTADLDCQSQRQLIPAGASLRRRLRRKLLSVLVASCYGGAQAAPVNPTVVAGQASFNFQGKTYSITNTPNAIINWQGFSLGADEVARFIQQSADSKVLNRITGQDPSVILGALQSNGKVFLINPNGVLFGAGSRVDVNGLVASSLAISNADFLAGKNNFAGGAGAGKVVNQGTLATPGGGQIFLIAPAVENSGVISSPNGDVVLAAGHSVQLFDSRDPNVQVVVSSPADQALNLGSIVAQGGRVGVYGALVNQRGAINADSAVVGANGKIVLKSSRTTLLEAGSATSARGTADGRGGANLNTGGDIVLLGAQVGLTGNAVVDASGGAGGGTVLVGGDYQGGKAAPPNALPNALQTHVGKDSVIKADATGLGDGGKIIVWSDQATQVFGAISARGGAAGGNGGFVETSGHYLDMRGRVDTRAPSGATGTLLLDPSDIYIASDSAVATAAGMTAGATPPANGGVFLETGAVADSLLLTSTLQTALATTDVTVTTANGAGSGAGKISVLSPVTWTSTHGLTLNADAGIELKASIDGANAPLRLNAAGAIVQTTSPIDGLHAASLSALAAGNIVMDNIGNTVTGVAKLVSTGGSASLTAASVNLGQSSVAGAGTLSVTAAGGDITLGQPLSVAGGLSLNAAHNINAPHNLEVGGTFTLGGGAWSQTAALPTFFAHDFRLDDGTFVRAAGGNGSAATPYLLADVYGLQGVATLPASKWFSLNGDIDAAGTANWNAGQGFVPLAGSDYPYAGTFNGNGHAITGLAIDRAGASNVGLFAVLGGGAIKNLTVDGSVRGNANVGGVAGSALAGAGGAIDNVRSSAAVTGVWNVGGLVGDNGAAISNASASGGITGLAGANAANIGGLAGRNLGAISASFASGDVSTTGFGYAGGLVGSNANDGAHVGGISSSYASGNVTTTGEIVGGLVGDNNGGAIGIAYATGNVQGGRNVGGLAGRNNTLNGLGGTIADVYATGNVSGNQLDSNLLHQNIGGLLGELFSGAVSNSYSSGAVDGAAFSGGVNGMVGALGSGLLHNGYFNADAAGVSADAAGTALTGTQSQLQASFAGFDFSTVWRNYDGHTRPMLKRFLTPHTISVSGGSGVTKTYDGASAAFAGSATGIVTGINGTLGYDGAVNVGTYDVGGLWSTRYDISYAGTSAQLVIQPRTVTATVTGSKTYDGAAYMEMPATFVFNNLVGGDTLGVSGLVSFSDKNAGSGKPMSVANPTLTNNGFGNYVLGGGITGTGSITRAALSLSGLNAVSRQYDGTTIAQLGGNASVAGINGDDVALAGVVSGTATFNNKNVGANKLVTVATGGLGLTGADAGNYVLVSPSDLHADITPATLTVSGFTANSRVYNLDYDSASATYGRRAVLSGGALAGVIGGDQVAIGGASATFADKNVGTAKSVTVHGVTLSGADSANYVLGGLPAGLTADITPAALTLSLAARDYNNSNVASLAGATLNGVLATAGGAADAVSLASGGATATYADKNAGVDKVVTIGGGGAGLTGADAGNYTLAVAKGTITPRALATWTASGGGLWSDAGNWQDGVAPSGANVLAATLNNTGGVVTYDIGAGATTLTSLRASGQGLSVTGGALTLNGTGAGASYANGGGLTLGGGALVLNGHMQISTLTLSGGVLSGTGSATQLGIGALAQSGGAIDIDGTLTVGDGGNIAIGDARAKAGITLNAGQGAITQSGALVTDSLHAYAANGIALTNSGNHIDAFEAIVNGGGNIALNNTVSGGELALGGMSTGGNIVIDNTGGIHTTGDIAAAGGLVSITAHSPITVNNGISAATILLDASTDIMLASTSSLNAGAAIGLNAGRGIVLGGRLRVPSSGRIAATAATGNITSLPGTTVNSNGGPVTLTSVSGAINVPSSIFIGDTVATLNDGAAAADAAAKAAADAAAKAAADAAAKAAADAAAKAAADAAAQAAADAAAQAAADAAAQAAADAAKAAAEAAAKAAADAAAQAAAKAAADVAVATQGRPGEPVGQALNATVNVINAVTTTASQIGAGELAGAGSSEKTGGGTAPDKESAVGDTGKEAEKTSFTAKKTYCN